MFRLSGGSYPYEGTTSAEVLEVDDGDASSWEWTDLGEYNEAQRKMHPIIVQMTNVDQLLICGGIKGTNSASPSASGEIYSFDREGYYDTADDLGGSAMNKGRGSANAYLMDNGSVLIVGGGAGSANNHAPVLSIELFWGPLDNAFPD